MLLHTKSSFAFLHCLKISHRSICLLLHFCITGKMMGSLKDEKLFLSKYGRTRVPQPLHTGHILQKHPGMVWDWYGMLFGTEWDTGGMIMLLLADHQVEAGVSCSCAGVSPVLDMDTEAATVLKLLPLLLPRILFFMGISYPGGFLASAKDLFCLLQQVALLCLIFLVYEMGKINSLQNSLTTNSTKGHEAMKRLRLVVTVSNYIASEISFLA